MLAPEELAAAAEAARVSAEAQNRARDLQSLPPTSPPQLPRERAEEIAAAHDEVTVEVLGRDEIARQGHGRAGRVSQGGPEEPRLIVLRYAGGGTARPSA